MYILLCSAATQSIKNSSAYTINLKQNRNRPQNNGIDKLFFTLKTKHAESPIISRAFGALNFFFITKTGVFNK